MASIFSLYGEIFVENQDAIKNLTNTDKKGSSVAKSLGGAMKTAGAAIGATVAAIGAVVTATIKAANDTAAAGDRIDKMSQKLGMSREGFQKWDYVLGQNGMSIESLQGGIKAMTNSLDDAAAGNDKAAAKFERLGISLDDLEGKSREDIFGMLITGLQGIEDEGEKAAIANDILGKSAADLMPLLNQSAESTQALADEAEQYGMIMSDDAVDASVAFSDSVDKMKGTFEGFKNNLIGQVLPALTMITDGLALLMSGDTSGIDSISAGFKNFLSVLGEILPSILELGGSLVMTLAQAVIDNLPELSSMAFELIGQLATFLLENLPAIIQAGMTILEQLLFGLGEALPEAIPAIVEVILTVVDTLISNADMLVDGAIALIMGLARGIIAAIPLLIEKAPEIVSKLVSAIIENVPKILEAGAQLIRELCSSFAEQFPALMAAAGEIIDTLINGVKGLFEKIKKIGKDIINKLLEGLKDAWKSVTSWFNGVWDKLFGNRKVKVSADVDSGSDGSHAGGLDYVPFDGYRATLHKGERVLTAAEVRQGDGNGSGVTIVQNINAVPQTPVELAAATNAYFTRARWA